MIELDDRVKIRVGNIDSDFITIRECMSALPDLKFDGKNIDIILTDTSYFEQVVVTQPNITIMPAGEFFPRISFYYGIGYKYMSIAEDGYFSEKSDATKHFAKQWGATFIVRDSARGFRARNIEFHNSFNFYVTEDELKDKIQMIDSLEYGQGKCEENEERVSIYQEVSNLRNKERAASMVCEADESEFIGCKFTSSQDTLYAGRGRQIYRNCDITGNVDYIFGEEDADISFFDCNLIWLGYTGGESEPGVICAPKGKFRFLRCHVKSNEDKNYSVSSGYLARPWRRSGSVVFEKCIFDKDTILKEGFTSMNGVEPEEVSFYEYDNFCDGDRYVSTRGKKNIIV